MRDQWNITPKITASVGVRWEYYSLPRRVDHGIEVYDFATNRLLICDVGPNDKNCGIGVEKNLFTPRLGIAYRPMEDAGHPRRLFAQPAEQQPGPPADDAVAVVSADDRHHPERAEQRHGGRVSQRRVCRLCRRVDQTSGVLALPAGAGVNTYQGRIRARQDLVVERQRPEGPWRDERACRSATSPTARTA